MMSDQVRWTERLVLDALHRRLCVRDRQVGSLRFAVAEKVGISPTSPHRILDLVAVDTWRSTGYALHGFEVKISRSDLLRELRDLGKSRVFTDQLDTFTIAAPGDVLRGWKDLPIPPEWGVLAVAETGTPRSLRRPTGSPGYAGATRTVDLGLVAALSRSISMTATRRCAEHGELQPARRTVTV